jgi:hypothetical protein
MISNRLFGNVAQFKCLEMTVTNQNLIHEGQIKFGVKLATILTSRLLYEDVKI